MGRLLATADQTGRGVRKGSERTQPERVQSGVRRTNYSVCPASTHFPSPRDNEKLKQASSLIRKAKETDGIVKSELLQVPQPDRF